MYQATIAAISQATIDAVLSIVGNSSTQNKLMPFTMCPIKLIVSSFDAPLSAIM